MLSLTFYSFPPYTSSQVCITYAGCLVKELLVKYNGEEAIFVFLQSNNKKPDVFKINVPEGILHPFRVSEKQLDFDQNQLTSMFSALSTSDRSDCNNLDESAKVKWGVEMEEGLISTTTCFTGIKRLDLDQDQLTSMFSALSTGDRSDCNNREESAQVKCDVVEIEQGLFSTKACFSVEMKKGLECVRKEKVSCASVADYLVDRIRIDTPTDIFCTQCGERLTDEKVSFEKVARCCEGMSSELSENWFCHAEATAPQAKSQSSQLLCFDSSRLYLHSSITEKMSVQKALEGTALACSGCRSVLTPSSRQRGRKCFTGFFCDKVELRHPGAAVKKDYAREMIWAILRGMVDDSSPVCKLYLHSKGLPEERCLLLCIRSPKVLWFSAHCKDQPSFISGVTQEALPVSFFSCKPGSKLVRTWRHDFEVDFYYVSDSMLRTVEECLASTSETLPRNFPAYIEGFRESFLPVL